MIILKSRLTKYLHLKVLNIRKTLGPEKCVVTLKLTFINEILEKKVNQLIRTTYYVEILRIIFTSKPLITPGGKNLVFNSNKNMIIYQFSCFCKLSYIGLTTKQLRKRAKQHTPKSIKKFCNSGTFVYCTTCRK